MHNVLRFLFPGRVWNEWELEGGTVKGFWQDINNHRRFIAYLSEKLDIGDSLDKWYRVTLQDVINSGGGSFLRFELTHPFPNTLKTDHTPLEGSTITPSFEHLLRFSLSTSGTTPRSSLPPQLTLLDISKAPNSSCQE